MAHEHCSVEGRFDDLLIAINSMRVELKDDIREVKNQIETLSSRVTEEGKELAAAKKEIENLEEKIKALDEREKEEGKRISREIKEIKADQNKLMIKAAGATGGAVVVLWILEKGVLGIFK